MSTSNAVNHPTQLFLEGCQIHNSTHEIGLWSHFPAIMKASPVWMTSSVGWLVVASGYPGPMPSPQLVLDADLLKLGPFCPRLSRPLEPALSVIKAFCLTETGARFDACTPTVP